MLMGFKELAQINALVLHHRLQATQFFCITSNLKHQKLKGGKQHSNQEGKKQD